MKKSVRTIYGIAIQNAHILGIPYEAPPHSTLNEALQVHQDLAPNTGEKPTAEYLAIGIGGRYSQVGADGDVTTSLIMHEPTHAGLYEQVPFVLRPLDRDLDLHDRNRYALRKVIQVDGRDYVAYYLLKLNKNGVVNQLQRIRVQEGVKDVTTYVPDSQDLHPTKPRIPNVGTITATGERLVAAAIMNFSLSERDVTEFVNAIKILYKNPLKAVISEVALVAGCERTVSGSTVGGTTFNYREVVQATIINHISAEFNLVYLDQGVDYQLVLGSADPAIGIADPLPGAVGP